MSHKNLAVQSEAISLYLDSLLRDVPDDEPQDSAAPLDEASPAAPQADLAAEPEQAAEQAEIAPENSTQAAPEPGATAPIQAGIRLEAQPDAIIPEWANGPFQAMLFKVGELSLALPIVELTGIVEWKELATSPDSDGILLGTYLYNGKPVPVVDTARLVLPPERLHELVGDTPQQRVSRIVIIRDGQWGLACDSVHELITFQPDKVRWHTAKTKRRWLAGTSVELMCAMLDTGGLVEILQADIKD